MHVSTGSMRDIATLTRRTALWSTKKVTLDWHSSLCQGHLMEGLPGEPYYGNRNKSPKVLQIVAITWQGCPTTALGPNIHNLKGVN